jgi:hypothetical protein
MRVIWVVLQPVVQVILCVLFYELICAADTQQHQGVKVVRIRLMSMFESQNCEFILVVFLVELAEQTPRFAMGLILLNLSL